MLRTNAYGFDAAAAKIEWFVDGSLDSTPVPTEFSCAGVSRGAKVRAKAVLAAKEIWSNTITVLNTPPTLTYAKLLPEVFRPGDVLKIEARAEDPDGDDVTLKYSWTRNGAPAGNTDQLTVQPRRGDRIIASVTPYDAEGAGETLTLDRDIGNLPPSFVEHQNASLQGDRYQYQAQARDPDGDTITFSLQSPSDGISINPVSGELLWAVPKGFTGDKTVTIVADDGHSGTAHYTVTFTIR
ncbi:MAG: Ig-like domain-containing protein [Nitrospirota bacterium]